MATSNCPDCAQYVGTVLNKALGHKLRGEVLNNDPAMITWITGNGHGPEDVTTELILNYRNSFNMSSESLGSTLSTEGKLCHATERCVSPQAPLTSGPQHILLCILKVGNYCKMSLVEH